MTSVGDILLLSFRLAVSGNHAIKSFTLKVGAEILLQDIELYDVI